MLLIPLLTEQPALFESDLFDLQQDVVTKREMVIVTSEVKVPENEQ